LEIQVIQVPYDSGQKEVRMGNGPAHLVKHSLSFLNGIHIDQVEVEPLVFELGTSFRILRALSEKVEIAVRTKRFPLVFAGGCISCIGTLAGLGPGDNAIVWLDAHGDFNTPEITPSGFPDGMALAMATGRCWKNLTSSVPGFQPILEENVIQIGARDFDPEERKQLESSPVTRINVEAIRSRGVQGALIGAIQKLKANKIYLHIDLDVLDISEARVNHFSSGGGLTIAELREIVRVIVHSGLVGAAAVTAFDPSCDEEGKIPGVVAALVKEFTGLSETGLSKAS
jgi:arginase